MHHEGEKIVVSTEEASSGEKRHEVRYILAISLALIIVLFVIITATGIMSSDAPEGNIAAPTQKTG
jgi:hypothetical protein